MGHFPWSDMAHLQSQTLLASILTVCQILLRLVKNSLECVHKVIVYGKTDGHDDSNSLQPNCWLRAKNISHNFLHFIKIAWNYYTTIITKPDGMALNCRSSNVYMLYVYMLRISWDTCLFSILIDDWWLFLYLNWWMWTSNKAFVNYINTWLFQVILLRI